MPSGSDLDDTRRSAWARRCRRSAWSGSKRATCRLSHCCNCVVVCELARSAAAASRVATDSGQVSWLAASATLPALNPSIRPDCHSAAVCGRSTRSRRNRLAVVVTRLVDQVRAAAISSAANSPGTTFPLSAATSSTGSARRRSMNSQIVAASSASSLACVAASSTIRSIKATSRRSGASGGLVGVILRTYVRPLTEPPSPAACLAPVRSQRTRAVTPTV